LRRLDFLVYILTTIKHNEVRIYLNYSQNWIRIYFPKSSHPNWKSKIFLQFKYFSQVKWNLRKKIVTERLGLIFLFSYVLGFYSKIVSCCPEFFLSSYFRIFTLQNSKKSNQKLFTFVILRRILLKQNNEDQEFQLRYNFSLGFHGI